MLFEKWREKKLKFFNITNQFAQFWILSPNSSPLMSCWSLCCSEAVVCLMICAFSWCKVYHPAAWGVGLWLWLQPRDWERWPHSYSTSSGQKSPLWWIALQPAQTILSGWKAKRVSLILIAQIPGEAVATAEGPIVIRHLRVSGSPSEQRQIESIVSGQIIKRETDTCEHWWPRAHTEWFSKGL